MKCPEEKIYYGVICEKFPEPSEYFETFNAAIRWAKSDQPAYRPYYIVECVEHYEICGCVDDKGDEKEMKNESKTYEQGLADAWEAAKKICRPVPSGGMTPNDLIKIFDIPYTNVIITKYTAAEAIAKIKAYEDEQAGIKVGDEVVENDDINKHGVVTNIRLTGSGNVYNVLWDDGRSCGYYKKEIKKTDRHFPQIEELLKAMKA